MSNVTSFPGAKPVKKRETVKEFLERCLKDIEDPSSNAGRVEDVMLIYTAYNEDGKTCTYHKAHNDCRLDSQVWLLEQSKRFVLDEE